jgi:hypothetical protein
MFLIPKTNIERMDKMSWKFFFGKGAGLRKNTIWLSRQKSAEAKRMGGLGIKDFRLMNISLLCK